MTATYNPTLPTALDRMRLALGDTRVSPEASALLPDETYSAKLAEVGETKATADLAEGLATRYAQEPDSVGEDGDTVSWRDRVKTWLELARRLRADIAVTVSATNNALNVVRLQHRHDYDDGTEYRRPDWWTPEW